MIRWTRAGWNPRIGFTYNAFGDLVQKTVNPDGYNIVVDYAYDTDHRLTQIELDVPGTSTYDERINYSLDAMGRPNGVTTQYLDSASGLKWTSPFALASSVTYEPFGPLGGLNYIYSGLVETRNYDTDYRVTSISIPGVEGLSYTSYDAEDNVKAVTDSVMPNHLNLSETYTYDSLNRLATENGYGSFAYLYDANGNRTQRTDTSSNAVTNYTIATNSNQLQAVVRNGTTYNYTYDSVGETIGDGTYDFTYGDDERLVSVSNAGTHALIANYFYDAEGLRFWKQVPGPSGNTNTVFVYDEQGHLLAEFTGKGALLTTHVWLGDRPLIFYSNGGVDTPVRYIHTDNLNTPRIMTNGATTVGWVWQSGAFGNGAVSAPHFGSNFYSRMPGQYLDAETGYTYNTQRDYDIGTGRYLESDPLGLEGGINTYVYVGGNPISRIDPLGQWWFGDQLPQGVVDFSAGFGDTLSFGATKAIRGLMDTNDEINTCSVAYDAGEISGTALSVAIGGGVGLEASSTRNAGEEFSHWIPDRMDGPRSPWNGNYVSPEFHYYTDPYRYPSGWDQFGAKWPAWAQQLGRIPNVYIGATAGGAYASGGFEN